MSEYELKIYEEPPTPHANFKYLTWELDALPDVFMHGLYSRHLNSSNNISRELLFAMFLAFTISPPSHSNTQNPALDVLVDAARRGYEPAQSVVKVAYEFFWLELQADVKEHLTIWLKRAVATGSTAAKSELEKLDLPALRDATTKFRCNGGYNKFYDTESTSWSETWATQHPKPPGIRFGYSHIHRLATFGTLPELLDYFDKNEACEIDAMTHNRETPLYLACARGSWEIAAELLRRGACPSIKCTIFEISCMHWVFAFDEKFQAEAIIELGCRRAGLNAATSQEIPFLHYPFVLPAGTPLHWAIATSSHTAVQALVEQGADVLIRNGSDPYIYDNRVRILNTFGGPNQEPYSFSEIGTQGLSPLDLAAMQHDPFIFELLAIIES